MIVGGMLVTGLAFGQVQVRPHTAAQTVKVQSANVQQVADDAEASSRVTYWSDTFGSGGPSTTDLPTGWSNTVTGGPVGFPGWEFTTVGHTGAYPTTAITSTSMADGWMIVDSDLHGTSGGGTPENCDLDSPVITLAPGTGPAYMLQFEQVFREYVLDVTTVSVTTDGFTTTTDYLINEGVGNVNPTPTTVMGILIASAIAGGESSVQIRFNWEGDWDYGWQIDDIAIVDAPNDDLIMNGQWYENATPNTAVNGFFGEDIYSSITMHPTAHADDVRFAAVSYNFGADTQTGVEFTVDDGGGIFATSAQITQVNGQTDTLMAGNWTNPATVGQYDFTYDLNYDDEANENAPADNMGMDSLWVTDGIFGTDKDFYTGTGWWNGEASPGNTNGFDIGNIYTMTTSDMAYAVECVVTASTTAGNIIFPRIYQYDALATDFVLVYDGQGFDEYTVTAADIPAGAGPDPVSIVLPLSTPYALTAGETYLACVGHYGGGADVLTISSGGYASYGEVLMYDYTATAAPFWIAGFSSSAAVRLWMNGSPIGIDEEAANIELGQNAPNPTNGITNINFSLMTGAETSFQVVDITGKVVYTENMGNMAAGSHNIVLDVTGFAQGVYYYTLTSGDFSASKKMIITE